jgi:glycosyltransferase involved in cell wall biosynthesis
MILIDAIYINTGGGKVLLDYFIDTLIKNKLLSKYYFLLDDRISNNLVDKLDNKYYKIITPSEKNRKLFYQSEINKFYKIFCFANVPPPINIENKQVFIYFHNTLLLDYSSSKLSFINKFLLLIKRTYINFKKNKKYTWIVQTKIIGDLLSTKLSIKKTNIEIIPIYNIDYFKNCNLSLKENNNHYLYVADASEQKNHHFLLDSWESFSKSVNNSNVFLHLTLSINSNQGILNRIDLLKKNGYNIINHGVCTAEKIKLLYTQCNFLIFPSLAESFGLPLIEATSAGCIIISANLPYVYQVIEPSITFNPNDNNSLTSALLLTQSTSKIKSSKLLVENKIIHLINKLSNV